MKYIVDLLIFVVSCGVSFIVFGIILSALNQSILNSFIKIQKFVYNLKRKELVKTIVMFIGIVLCVEIKDLCNLNTVRFGILIGFLYALYDVIFKTGFASKKNEDV